MRTYIKVWIIITCIVDMFVFSYLSADGGSKIRCNRVYNKIYPCHVSSEVTKEIQLPLCASGNYRQSDSKKTITENTVSKKTYTENVVSTRTRLVSDEPSLREANSEKLGSDLAVIFRVLITVDIMLAGIAILLYFVLVNIEEQRTLMSSGFSIALFAFIAVSVLACNYVYQDIRKPGEIKEIHYNAPIIYLYDEQEREATVKLDLKGELTCTYPRYNEETGWIVKTSPDGVLTDANGRQYEYLYWEADVDMDPDFTKGFCVRGEDSAEFLEKALADMGLSDTEANAFIMYWLPQLEENPYNVISFQTESYEDVAKLDVDPLPDTVVRVNMLFYGADEYVNIEEQDLTVMNPSLAEREGFVLVEWGGGKLG